MQFWCEPNEPKEPKAAGPACLWEIGCETKPIFEAGFVVDLIYRENSYHLLTRYNGEKGLIY